MKLPVPPAFTFNPARRRFVQGLVAGGVLASFPALLHAGSRLEGQAHTGTAPVLSGQIH